MAPRLPSSSPLRLLAPLLVLVALVGLLRARAPGSAAESAPGPCPEGPADCPPAEPEGSPATRQPTVIAASEVCLSAGYLCAELLDAGEVRIARRNGDTDRLRIRVPRPDGLDARRARELQEAAARGLRAWHGRPFPMRVDLSDRPGPEDFAVTWRQRMGERRLGRASTRWTLRDGRADLEVTELTLVTHDPWKPGRALPPRQVELTAAHEMGHALGLPHSDEPRDVMYPENTATRLTARDYITMSSLYELENGAVVRVVR